MGTSYVGILSERIRERHRSTCVVLLEVGRPAGLFQLTDVKTVVTFHTFLTFGYISPDGFLVFSKFAYRVGVHLSISHL